MRTAPPNMLSTAAVLVAFEVFCFLLWLAWRFK